jgi:peroxiredoxin
MQEAKLPPDLTFSIPLDLPKPLDDGACDHLEKLSMPGISLISTEGKKVNLSCLSGWSVIFFYPMTGRPGVAIPEGWADIPGAAGCTSQVCSFTDRHTELKRLGAELYGVSAQTTELQKEASIRLNLSYPLLSDSDHSLSVALKLPVFDAGGLKLIKRLTLIVKDGEIKKCFYPVFPPNKNVSEVLAWFSENQA